MALRDLDNFMKAIRKEKVEYSSEKEMRNAIRSFTSLLPSELRIAADATEEATIATIELLRQAMKREINRLVKQREELEDTKVTVSRQLSQNKRQINRIASPAIPVQPSLHDIFIVMVLQRWTFEDRLSKFDTTPSEGEGDEQGEGEVELVGAEEPEESDEDEDMID